MIGLGLSEVDLSSNLSSLLLLLLGLFLLLSDLSSNERLLSGRIKFNLNDLQSNTFSENVRHLLIYCNSQLLTLLGTLSPESILSKVLQGISNFLVNITNHGGLVTLLVIVVQLGDIILFESVLHREVQGHVLTLTVFDFYRFVLGALEISKIYVYEGSWEGDE